MSFYFFDFSYIFYYFQIAQLKEDVATLKVEMSVLKGWFQPAAPLVHVQPKNIMETEVPPLRLQPVHAEKKKWSGRVLGYSSEE